MENATFASPRNASCLNGEGTLAQMVEQRTENPCVPGSIPGGTTLKKKSPLTWAFLFISIWHKAFQLALSSFPAEIQA